MKNEDVNAKAAEIATRAKVAVEAGENGADIYSLVFCDVKVLILELTGDATP